MIAWLNAQREANGIPGGITENPYYSEGCRLHELYMQKNNYFGHPEDPSKPGYTDQGNDAGTSSVLAEGWPWTSPDNPWETAPIHLAQMLAPALDSMGAWQQDGYVCASTWPGYNRTAPDTNEILTYPGDGTSGIYSSEKADEWPFIPGDFVGLPLGTVTGPYLYVYVWGPWANEWDGVEVVSASLTAPDGTQIEVRHVDRDTAKIGPYLPSGSGILMPVKPLQPGTTFKASVTMSFQGQTLEHDWTFTTKAGQKPKPAPKPSSGGTNGNSSGPRRLQANPLRVFVRPLGRGRYAVLVISPAPHPHATLRSGGVLHALQLKHPGSSFYDGGIFHASPGDQVCAASGGAGSGFKASHSCSIVR